MVHSPFLDLVEGTYARNQEFFPVHKEVSCEFSHDPILGHLIFQCFFSPFGIQEWFSIHLVAWSPPKYRGGSKCDVFPANLGSRAPFVSLERVDLHPEYGPVLEGDVDDEKRRAPSW